MSVKIVPITAYDFDYFKMFLKNNYGVDIAPATFDVNIQDPENPKCGNCDIMLRGAHANLRVKPRYCIRCGAELVWPDNYRGWV